MADHKAPGYELEPELTLDTDQLRMSFHATRMAIVELLTDRAATTSQLPAPSTPRPGGDPS
jgi:hypothetical protein